MTPRSVTTALVRSTRTTRQIPYRHLLPRYDRQFSNSARVQTSEDPSAFVAAFQNTSIFKKIANRPEALAAIEDLAKILQNAGVDLTSGKQPSTLKMMKLAANSDFRNSMKQVAEEMNKAGIVMSSPDVMKEIMSLSKAVGPPK